MPITALKNTKRGSEIGIWTISESLADLEQQIVLLPDEHDSYQKLKTKARKKQWLTVRIILNKLEHKPNDYIYYNDQGKPFLRSGKAVSISHSGDYVALIVANYTVAIDIQTPKKNISEGSSIFMSETEKETFDLSNINDLHLIWCAKEVLYKLYGTKNNSVFTDFLIIRIDREKGEIYGKHKLKNCVKCMNFEITNGYYLVYI